MNCSDLKLLLIEHLDGRLDADREAGVRAHLAGCAACSRDAAAHRRAWDLVGRLPAIDPGPRFAAAVGRRVRRSRVLTILGSCAAAAAVAVGLMLFQKSDPAPVDTVLNRMPPEDRALLEELARDRTWELADNIEVVRTFELLDANGAPATVEEDH
jgi:anti-sigma factor RsiW